MPELNANKHNTDSISQRSVPGLAEEYEAHLLNKKANPNQAKVESKSQQKFLAQVVARLKRQRMKFQYAALAVLFMVLTARPALAGLRMYRQRPCKLWEHEAANKGQCQWGRFVPCGTYATGIFNNIVIRKDNPYSCHIIRADPYDRYRSNFVVQFDGHEGCLEIKMKVGECW